MYDAGGRYVRCIARSWRLSRGWGNFFFFFCRLDIVAVISILFLLKYVDVFLSKPD